VRSGMMSDACSGSSWRMGWTRARKVSTRTGFFGLGATPIVGRMP
jgi:hypothetical protein